MEAKRSPQRRSSLQTPRWAKATVTGVCAHGDGGLLRAGPLRPTPPDSESGAGRPDGRTGCTGPARAWGLGVGAVGPCARPGAALVPVLGWARMFGARRGWVTAAVWTQPVTSLVPVSPFTNPTLLSRRQPHPAVSPRETSLRLCLQTRPSAGAEQRAMCLPPPPRSVASPEATEDSLSIWLSSITHLGIRALNLI